MGGVLGHHEAHAVLLGLLDGQVHAVGADVQTQTHVAVHQRRGAGLLHDVDGLVRVQDAVLDAVEVDGLQAANAVGVNAALVGLNKNVGGNAGLVGGNTDGLEAVDHELLQVIEVQANRTFDGFILMWALVRAIILTTFKEEVEHLLSDSNNHIGLGSADCKELLQVGVVLLCYFRIVQVLGVGDDLRSLLSSLLNLGVRHFGLD